MLGGCVAALGGLATKLLESTVVFSQMLWVGVVALGGLSVRSLLGYRRAKHTRLSQMTHHLYYQNVANNAGVLDQLVASIGQEELKEALLAYAIVHGGEVGDVPTLARRASQWLAAHYDVAVDFDGPDAVATLERLGLWADREGWALRPPAEAVQELARRWQERLTVEHHLQAATGGRASAGAR